MKRSELSTRGSACTAETSIVMQTSDYVDSNKYHPVDNPEGLINLGMSENKLCPDLIQSKLSEIGAFAFESHCQYYPIPLHTTQLRQSIASFMSKALGAVSEVKQSEITFFNGVDCAMAALAHCLADPGEYFVTLGPYYYLAKQNFATIPEVKILTFEASYNSETDDFIVDTDLLEKFLTDAVESGKKIRALLLVNPNNPTGDVYTEQQLLSILNVCKRQGLHVLLDEIYGLTVHSGEFRSGLSLSLPDPSMTHVLWGFSKDFSLSGLRMGAICSRNVPLCEALVQLEHYYMVPPIVVSAAYKLLQHSDWLLSEFMPENKRRIRERFEFMSSALRSLGVAVHVPKGGFFLFANFKKFYEELVNGSFDETAAFRRLLTAGVYVVPGSAFSCAQPGWFRVVYAHPRHELVTALDRLKKLKCSGVTSSE